ncbi:MAG: nuclear transport factor 2 family protein [Pseudomonadota bacterium]
MKTSSDHVSNLSELYQQWHDTKGGSVDAWMEILADEIDFKSLAMGHEDGAKFTAPRIGKKAVQGYFEELLEDWKMISFTVDDFIADGNKICVLCSTAWVNKATGKKVETPKVDLWEFKDRKAISFFEFYDTAALLEGANPG